MALGMSKINDTSILAAEEIATSALEWASVEGTVINMGTDEQVVDCMLQIALVFVNATSEDAEVHIRYSLDDSTTKDTPEVKTFATVIENPGNTTPQIISYRVPGMFDYLDVGIKNLDGSNVITTAKIVATYTKLTGLAVA